MRFLVDAMFGRLARWLRMSGYDTIYATEHSDTSIIQGALKEERLLITRDKELYKRAVDAGVKTLYMDSTVFREQLRSIEKRLGIRFRDKPDFSRCPICNAGLKRRDKKDINAKLPEKVGTYHDLFYQCKSCDKIYWEGGHWKNIQKVLKESREG